MSSRKLQVQPFDFELHQADTKFHFILDAAPDAILIIDTEGQIMLVNVQVENIFGYKREEIIGKTVEVLIPERYRHLHPTHRNHYFSDPHVRPMGVGLELYGLHKDGSEFPVEISLSPLETEQGIFGLAAIRDITERKKIEHELREKNIELENASLAKDRFLATMSHELRTPLNAIIGFTGTLLMRLPGSLNEEQEKQLNTIKRSAKHLLSLINDLLDLAKIESGKVELKLERINCQQIIKDVVTTLMPLCQSKHLELTAKTPPSDIYVMTDARALTQIIINLANNSIKFTEKGKVEIELYEQHQSDKEEIIIKIKDTGIGIKNEDQTKLFQAFQQIDSGKRRTEGSGLGLHLCKKLAELIHGRLEFFSEFGKGSTFSIILNKGNV